MKGIIEGLRALWPLVEGYRLRMATVLVVMLFAGVFEFVGLSMLLPLLAIAIDEPIAMTGAVGEWFKALAELSWGFTATAGIMLIAVVLKSCLTIYLAYANTSLSVDLRTKWAERIFLSGLYTPLAVLSNQRVGELVESVSSETQKAGNAVGSFLQSVQQLLLAAILITGLFISSPWLTLCVLLLSFSVLGILRFFRVFESIQRGKRMLNFSRAVSNISAETMANVRQIKVLNAYSQRLHDLKESLRRYAKTRVAFKVSNQIPPAAVEVGIMFAALVGLVIAYQMSPGMLRESLPLLAMFAAMAGRLVNTIGRLSNQTMKLNVGMANIQYVGRRIEQESTAEQLDQGDDLVEIANSAQLSNVDFSWPGRVQVLRGVNMEFLRGEVTAIAGASGRGKSTIAALLTGLLQPDNGSVLFDGVPLDQYNLRSIRRGTGYVTQETELFHGSIAENIRMGWPDATDEMVRDAARAAHASDFIEQMPERYDTIIGERGATLSGGQRQRISLARALLGERHIYIFDEATSALDEQTQLLVQETIHSVSKKAIVIVIAHRPSAIECVDRVYYIDKDGTVAKKDPGNVTAIGF